MLSVEQFYLPKNQKEYEHFVCTPFPYSRAVISLHLHKGRGFLYVHLWLVNFPDKHCFCGHKSELRILLSYSLFNLAQVKRFIFVQFFLVVFLCKIIYHFAHSFIIITEFYVVICVKINMLGFFN